MAPSFSVGSNSCMGVVERTGVVRRMCSDVVTQVADDVAYFPECGMCVPG